MLSRKRSCRNESRRLFEGLHELTRDPQSSRQTLKHENPFLFIPLFTFQPFSITFEDDNTTSPGSADAQLSDRAHYEEDHECSDDELQVDLEE